MIELIQLFFESVYLRLPLRVLRFLRLLRFLRDFLLFRLPPPVLRHAGLGVGWAEKGTLIKKGVRPSERVPALPPSALDGHVV